MALARDYSLDLDLGRRDNADFWQVRCETSIIRHPVLRIGPGCRIHGIGAAQDSGEHLHQPSLRVGRLHVRAPRHKAIGPQQHGSLSRHTHFCLPAILKVD
jgi:hypothetical protein